MKRNISALAAVMVCAVMLTSCGGNNEQGLTDETAAPNETIGFSAAEVTASVTTEAVTTTAEETTTSETEAATSEAETTSDEDEGLVYASLEEFANSDLGSIEGTEIAFEESCTYDFTNTLGDADSFFLDVESVDDTIAMTMAFEEKKIALDAIDENGERFIVIIKDSTMYMLNPAEKQGFYMQADESIWDEYNSEEMLGEIDIDEDAIKESEYLNSCPVIIDGEKFTCESDGESCFLYNEDGELSAIVVSDDSYEINALIVNKFTAEVPSSAFDIPDEYELTDLDAALSALQ